MFLWSDKWIGMNEILVIRNSEEIFEKCMEKGRWLLIMYRVYQSLQFICSFAYLFIHLFIRNFNYRSLPAGEPI